MRKTMMQKKNLVLALALAIGLVWMAPQAWSQAQVTGAIQGVVTDPSGAALPNAGVTLKNVVTGAAQNGTSDSRGEIRFSLLPPSTYILTVTAKGFETASVPVTVSVGQVTTSNVKMTLGSSATTVEVTGQAPPLIQTENANTSSTLTSQQVKDLPVPGSDINYLALLSPGAIQVGGSSFPSVQGLPTTSNLITVNGMEDIDPWNNSTNGGASNLLLGLNEVQESTVTSNGFNGSYGTLAGSNVNMVTKSGGNNFHGNLVWDWTGRAMESNDFFHNAVVNKTTGAPDPTPRPFTNANQWAGSFGGPILHNKLFFFVDNEGLALVLPGSSSPVYVPTQAFQTATIANLAAVGQNAEVPFYQSMFKLWSSAPGAANAQPVTGGGCGTVVLAGAAPCVASFLSDQTNTSHEIITTFRVDYNLSSADHAYFHYLLDRGVQNTGVDPINPAFNAISVQPSFNAQFAETHTFGGSAVNQFQAAAQHYQAIFGPSNIAAALAVFPTTISFADGSFTNLGGSDNSYPAGRNVTRYQFSDDYSHLWGNHSFQTGFYFSRYDATDFQFGSGTSGLITAQTIDGFYNGGYDPTPGDKSDFSTYQQSYPVALEQPLAMYRLGVYAQDEWHVTDNLSLSLALRLDHPSNPVCVDKCFADTAGFLTINHGASVPYNASIQAGLRTGLPALQALETQPRFGFSWQPWGAAGKTAIRGGFGMFGDNFPLSTITGFATNVPQDPSFAATGNASTGYVISPGLSNSLQAATNASYKALESGFSNGATLAQIQAAVPGFTLPNLTSSDAKIINPTYYKWNLDVQRQLWSHAAIDLAYDGNHGVHELISNANVNAYSSNFAGLPTAPLDPRFLTVTDYQSDGISNYNGMTASFNDRFKSGVLQLNYTWSHALDDAFGTGGTRTTIYPNNPRLAYGPSDVDYRNYASATYLWNAPFDQWFGGPHALTGGWEVSGSLIARTGGPMYVYNTTSLSATGFGSIGSGGRVLANYNGGVAAGSCQSPATPCFTATGPNPEFTKATTGYSTTQGRDMFRGPGYWNTNLTLSKHFNVPFWERANFELAGEAYNLFNHPNFANPGNNLSSANSFGIITGMVNPSSSPLGSNGADTSVRIIQLHFALTF